MSESNSNFDAMLENIVESQLDMAHVSCHSSIGVITIGNMHSKENGALINADIITIDGEPNDDKYYIFWNMKTKLTNGKCRFKTPGIFSAREDLKGRCQGNIPGQVLRELAKLQDEAKAERDAARAETTAANARDDSGSIDFDDYQGEGGYDDYANDLPPVETADEPPF